MIVRPLTLTLAVVLGGCFGQPEDIFQIDGTVADGLHEALRGVTVRLQRDQGYTEEGCSEFSDFVSLTSDETGAFHHTIIRQQTRGSLAELRCFRAIVEGTDGARTVVTWPFANADVTLPKLWLWPTGECPGPCPEPALSTGFFDVRFRAFPTSWGLVGAGVQPRAYRVELTSPEGRRAWRVPAFDMFPMFVRPSVFGHFEDWAYVGGEGYHFTASGIDRVERYERDPFGQLRASLFERRVESPPAAFPYFQPYPLPTVGAGCALPVGLDGGCLLTDGDPTPNRLPPGTRAISVVLPATGRPRNLIVQGLGADGPFSRLTVDSSPDETGGFSSGIGTLGIDWNALTNAEVSRDDLAPTLDVGPVLLSTPDAGARRLQIRAVNVEGQTIGLKWVGEITAY